MTIYETRRDRREKAPVSTFTRREDLLTRQEAAALAGVSVRSITRYATEGYLTKFRDARGRIGFAPEQVRAMGYFEAEPKPGRPPKVKEVCEQMHPDGTEAKWCILDPDHSGDHSDGTDSWPPG
jgi:hypothetical protein